MDKLLSDRRACRTPSRPPTVGIRPPSRSRTRCAAHPAMPTSRRLGRRGPARGPLPASPPEAGHAAPGRADQPRRESEGLEPIPQGISRWWPSPMTATLDNVAGRIPRARSRAGIPWKATTPRGSSRRERPPRRRSGIGASARWSTSSSGAHVARARQPPRRLQACWTMLAEGGKERTGRRRSSLGRGHGSATSCPGRASRRGLRRPPVIEDLNFSLPRGGIVGVTEPMAGRPRCSDDHGQEKPDQGSVARGRDGTVSPTSTRADSPDPKKNVWEWRSQAAPSSSPWAAARWASRAYVASFNFGGSDQQRRSAICQGASATKNPHGQAAPVGHLARRADQHLDVAAARVEDALLSFAGCAVVISHDRGSSTASPPTCRLRGRQSRGMVEGNLPGRRGGPQERSGCGRRAAAPAPLQAPREQIRRLPAARARGARTATPTGRQSDQTHGEWASEPARGGSITEQPVILTLYPGGEEEPVCRRRRPGT